MDDPAFDPIPLPAAPAAAAPTTVDRATAVDLDR